MSQLLWLLNVVNQLSLIVQLVQLMVLFPVEPVYLVWPFEIVEFVHSYCFSSVQPAKLDWEVCADEFLKLVMHFVQLNLLSVAWSFELVEMVKLNKMHK